MNSSLERDPRAAGAGTGDDAVKDPDPHGSRKSSSLRLGNPQLELYFLERDTPVMGGTCEDEDFVAAASRRTPSLVDAERPHDSCTG